MMDNNIITKQIRRSIFETNSSSVHTYTNYYKPVVHTLSSYLKSAADSNGIVNINLSWGVNEDGDLSPSSKLNMIFSSIPDFYDEDQQYTTISKTIFLANKIVKEIRAYIEITHHIKLQFRSWTDESTNVELDLERPCYEYGNSSCILDDLYSDLDKIIDFLEDTSYRMNVSEEYDG